jgi:excisionase family DNA binding protein
MEISDLLSFEETAAALHKSATKVRRLMDDGRLTRIELGGKCVRFARADVERLKAELTGAKPAGAAQ